MSHSVSVYFSTFALLTLIPLTPSPSPQMLHEGLSQPGLGAWIHDTHWVNHPVTSRLACRRSWRSFGMFPPRSARPAQEAAEGGGLGAAPQVGLGEDRGLLPAGPQGEDANQVPLPQAGGRRLQHGQAGQQGQGGRAEGGAGEQGGQEPAAQAPHRPRRGLQRLRASQVQPTQVQVCRPFVCSALLTCPPSGGRR